MRQSSLTRLTVLFGLLALVLATGVQAWSKEKDLPDRYRRWLDQDVIWIISKVEKEVFLSLKTDTERDRFIDNFWLARDPSPGTPKNEFKDEHYRRINYANAHFNREGGPGWRTDRGHMYILLGPPAQVFDFYTQYQVYPLELWFYSARQHTSLPNHFHLIFWQVYGAGGFKLYSPYNDGPEKLVHATFNDRYQCYQYLRGINAELARASLTYLPNEPIDIYGLTPSLSSDMLVNQIYRVPEAEAPVDYLSRFVPPDSKLREKVVTSYSFEFMNVQSSFFPVIAPDGKAMLHYAFQIAPEDLSIARYKDEYYASLQINLNISTPDNHNLLHHSQDLVRYYNEEEFRKIQSSPLRFEDKVAILPGKYQVDLVVLNRINGKTYRSSRVLDIPTPPAVVPAISQLSLMEAFRKLPEGTTSLDALCFTFFGYKFTPLLNRVLRPVEYLNILYQLYYPPDKARAESGENLQVEYRIIGQKGTSYSNTITDPIAKGKFNAAGSMLNFKQLPAKDLPPGQYMLVVAVRETSGRILASENLSFNVDPSLVRPRPNAYSSPELEADDSGRYDFQRAMILFALKRTDDAREALRTAVLKAPTLTPAVVKMAGIMLDENQSAKAVELLERVKDNQDFPPTGYLLLGRAYLGINRQDDALQALDRYMKDGQPTRSDLEELATLYDRLGAGDKAAVIRRQVSTGKNKQ